MPEEIISIANIYRASSEISASLFSLGYQLKLSAVTSILEVQGGTLDYYMRMTSLAELKYMMTPLNSFRFKETEGRLYIDHNDWSSLSVGDTMAIEAYRKILPENSPKMWNDMFLKKYTVALFKFQWGSNLSKFENIQMPGGVTFNGQELMSQAKEQLDELQDQVLEKYEEPTLGMMA